MLRSKLFAIRRSHLFAEARTVEVDANCLSVRCASTLCVCVLTGWSGRPATEPIVYKAVHIPTRSHKLTDESVLLEFICFCFAVSMAG